MLLICLLYNNKKTWQIPEEKISISDIKVYKYITVPYGTLKTVYEKGNIHKYCELIDGQYKEKNNVTISY